MYIIYYKTTIYFFKFQKNDSEIQFNLRHEELVYGMEEIHVYVVLDI